MVNIQQRLVELRHGMAFKSKQKTFNTKSFNTFISNQRKDSLIKKLLVTVKYESCTNLEL